MSNSRATIAFKCGLTQRGLTQFWLTLCWLKQCWLKQCWLKQCFLILCLSLFALSARGQDGLWAKIGPITPHHYVCHHAAQKPVVDGRLDDPAWQAAPWTVEFVDIEGDRKPRPRFRTRAKMLWDEEFFYVAARLDEPHVWGTLDKHDSVIFRDNDFEVFVDPDGDNHQYYEFEINALNTGWDLTLSKPYMDSGKADNSWEIPGLKTAVHVAGSLNDPSDRDEYWSVEIAFPWSAFSEFAHVGAPPRAGDQWRVNFSRVQWKHEVTNGRYEKVPNIREDNWVWSPQGIINMHRPERWAYVQFSDGQPETAVFQPDPDHAVRERLMELYHRQRAFRASEGRWATALEELNYAAPEGLTLNSTDGGYRAELEGKRGVWQVSQDSRLSLRTETP